MHKALQGDGIKELKDLLLKREPVSPRTQYTSPHVERLESFAFLKEFSGISYQTHSGGRALKISH